METKKEEENKRYKFKIIINYDEECEEALKRSAKEGKTMGWLTLKIEPKTTPLKKVQQVLLQSLVWATTGNPDILKYITDLQQVERKKGSRYVV